MSANREACGCGNWIKRETIFLALEKGKKLVCSVCGARGEPKRLAERLSSDEGCRYCGCPEWHDGEACPTAVRLGLVKEEV
jgi:hypothetical protein